MKPKGRSQMSSTQGSGGFVVRGHVTSTAGRPVIGVTVRAFDRDLRSEQALGEARTGAHGEYRITYTKDRFSRAEKASADLLMGVVQGETQLYETAVDAIVFNAPADAVIDIVVTVAGPRIESEYERILRAVRPLLDGVALDGLREDAEERDITFLAGETRFGRDQLAHFGVAQKLSTAS